MAARLCWAQVGCAILSLLTTPALAAQPNVANLPHLPVLSSPHWALQHWYVDESGVLKASTMASQAASAATHPASITKLLTAYVTLKSIAAGHITLSEKLDISLQAISQEGTRVGYLLGEQVSVQDALQGLLAISGNDAAWALAQHVGSNKNTLAKRDEKGKKGDIDAVSRFVSLMNQASLAIGLQQSQWQNPHGLSQDGHYSSADDLLKLAHALWRDFPNARPWLGVKTYTWHGLTQSNRNSLLWRDASVDGLKTGHTNAAGYNLVASSHWPVFVGKQREKGLEGAQNAYDWRLTSIVLGASTQAARAIDSAALLQWARSAYMPWRMYERGEAAGKVALLRSRGQHPVAMQNALWLVLPNTLRPTQLRYELVPIAKLTAPVKAGTTVAMLHVYDGQTLLHKAGVVSVNDIDRAPWYDWIRYQGL